MADERTDIRDAIADILSMWSLNGSEESQSPAEVAEEILDIPEISDALRLKLVKPMNLGHSIKVNPPK